MAWLRVLQSAGPWWLVALWHVSQGVCFGCEAVVDPETLGRPARLGEVVLDLLFPLASSFSLLVLRGVPLFLLFSLR